MYNAVQGIFQSYYTAIFTLNDWNKYNNKIKVNGGAMPDEVTSNATHTLTVFRGTE